MTMYLYIKTFKIWKKFNLKSHKCVTTRRPLGYMQKNINPRTYKGSIILTAKNDIQFL